MTTEVSREGARRHRLVGGAAEALSRVLTASALMATLTKDDERITVRLVGAGPLSTLTADADARGMLRGYPMWKRARRSGGAAVNELAKTGYEPGTGTEHRNGAGDKSEHSLLKVPELMGKVGHVVVLRDLGLKEIYQGQCAMTEGEIDLDIEQYLKTSEQLPSVLRCRALVDGTGQITAAAGVLIQNMPGGEHGLEEFRSVVDGGVVDRFIETGRTAEELFTELKGPGREILEWRQLRFECRCSKERAARALRTCGASEIRDIIQKERSTTLTCHFCNDKWRFEQDELERILSELERTA